MVLKYYLRSQSENIPYSIFLSTLTKKFKHSQMNLIDSILPHLTIFHAFISIDLSLIFTKSIWTDRTTIKNTKNVQFSVASSQHDASECQTDIPEPHGSNGGIVHQFQLCRKSCCSDLAQKVFEHQFLKTVQLPNRTSQYAFFYKFQMYFGICVTVLLTASWVGSTHCIKYLYLRLITSSSLGIIDKNQSVYNTNIHTVHSVSILGIELIYI